MGRTQETLRALSLAACLCCCVLVSCKKNAAPANGAASPAASPAAPDPGATPAIVGPVQPAFVGKDASSFTSHLHFPKDASVANVTGTVQFYCDLSETGDVEHTWAVLGSHPPFSRAVQTALDWGKFEPAKIDGKATAVYVGGTVFFMRDEKGPLIVVSLATHDHERVGKLANYIQPQIVGGMRRVMERAESRLEEGVWIKTGAEVIVNLDPEGQITSTSIKGETPEGTGFGLFLEQALRREAQYIPAFSNGKKVPGSINVVAVTGEDPGDEQ